MAGRVIGHAEVPCFVEFVGRIVEWHGGRNSFCFPSLFSYFLCSFSSNMFGGLRAGGFDLTALGWYPSVEAVHVYTSQS